MGGVRSQGRGNGKTESAHSQDEEDTDGGEEGGEDKEEGKEVLEEVLIPGKQWTSLTSEPPLPTSFTYDITPHVSPTHIVFKEATRKLYLCGVSLLHAKYLSGLGWKPLHLLAHLRRKSLCS